MQRSRLNHQELAALLREKEEQLRTPPTRGGHNMHSGETDQWRVYKHITEKLGQRQPTRPLRLLVQASAGTGKSFLLSTVFLWCLVNKKHVSAFAPTGIAAANIGRGMKGTDVCATTYHHLFGLNGELDSKMNPDKASDPYVQKLAATEVFMGDEFSMLDTKAWGTIGTKIAAVERWRHKKHRQADIMRVVSQPGLASQPTQAKHDPAESTT